MAASTTTDPAAQAVAEIGPRVRALRDAAGLSLRDLSARTAVSPPMLSQVERGETSPTLAVAARIAAGLDLSLSQLLRLDESHHVAIVRAGEGRSRTRAGHMTSELTAGLPGQRADVSRHELAPAASTGGPSDPPLHEPGSRETAIVLEGELTLEVDGERHVLETGDSVTFDADLPHGFRNDGTAPARFIAVVAAGLRRG